MAPGELLEGAEGHHGSHALAGGREGGVEQDVADTGHVHHAVVVQVGGERHPVATTKKETKNVGFRAFHNLHIEWLAAFWENDHHEKTEAEDLASKHDMIPVTAHQLFLRTSQQLWSNYMMGENMQADTLMGLI